MSINSRVCAYTLFSSSKGNSTFITDNETGILIDAGLSSKRINEALSEIGYSPKIIKAIFITHEHSDHIKALEVFTGKYKIPVHIAKESAKNSFFRNYSNTVLHDSIFEERIGNFIVTSFRTPHDSSMSVGYKICCNDTKIGIATDIGYITRGIACALIGCDAVILESNHDVSMLENGSYPYNLKMRILSNYGHLSNDACAKFVPTLAENGAKSILLAHLSPENNTEEIAYNTSKKQLDLCGMSDVCLKIASKTAPTRLI